MGVATLEVKAPTDSTEEATNIKDVLCHPLLLTRTVDELEMIDVVDGIDVEFEIGTSLDFPLVLIRVGHLRVIH